LWRGALCERGASSLRRRADLVEERCTLEEWRAQDKWRVHTTLVFLLEEGRT
jgi:hypothetical protein